MTPAITITKPQQGGIIIRRKDAWVPDELRHRIAQWSPKSDLGRIVRECFGYLPVYLAAELIDRITSCVVLESSLSIVVFRGPETTRFGKGGAIEDYGVVSRKVITTAGVNFLVDAWQNSVELEVLKYHGIGVGIGAEAAGDTTLGTELTTEYNPNSTRATGNLTEGATANVFRSVGTNTLDSGTPAVTEHGLFSAASAGTLWDRSVFSAINLVGANGDGLQTTYDMSASSGG